MLMRLSFILLFLVSFTLKAGTQYEQKQGHPLLRFLASSGATRDQVLYRLIAKRCSFYMHPGKVSECQNIVDELLSYLDHDLVTPSENSFLFVAFKTELKELMSDAETTVFIRELNHALTRRISRDDLSFNLWNWAREKFSSDRKAAKMLAILLQDTSPKKCHLHYLALTPNPTEVLRENVELLAQLIDNMALLSEQLDRDQSPFYPTGIGKEFNPSALYHFYMPYYLGMRLAYATPLEFSYSAPLMLTLTYEFITTGDDLRFLNRDPDTITNQWKIRDIYAGHAGAALAVGKERASFDDLKASFARSTKSAVELISY